MKGNQVIPKEDIPKLVEWLAGKDTGFDVASSFWTIAEYASRERFGEQCEEMQKLRKDITVALEAFNERKSNGES